MFTQLNFGKAQSIQLLRYNSQQWQLENRGNQGLIDIDIDLLDAWKIATGGKTVNDYEIVVAIIDGGVNTNHPDLSNNIWKNPYETPNGLDDDGNGYIDDIHGWNFKTNTNDVLNGGFGHFHGSPINGIIGADGTNNFGVSGINQSVKLLNLVRGEDSTSILQCHRYILNLRKEFNNSNGQKGAFIVAINNSWGFDSLKAEDYMDWCSIYDELGNEGILTVNSVPNLNIDIDETGDIPSTCSSDYLITVTNTDYEDHKVDGSGNGKLSLDLAAPGEQTYTVSNTGDFGLFGGNSAAAAYVSGTVALLYSIPSFLFENDLMLNANEFAIKVKSSILDGSVPMVELENISTSGGRLNIKNAAENLLLRYGDEVLLSQLETDDRLIAIYPNPTKEKSVVTIELSVESNIQIDVFDLKGTKMNTITGFLPSGIQSIEVPTNHLKPGIFTIIFTTESFRKQSLLLKNGN